jgi:histidinol-phosphate aminotransferase
MLCHITPKTRIVFIANPNNPTGTLVHHDEVATFIEQAPKDVLIVMDEAYDEYVTHPQKPKTIPYVLQSPNVAVLRTFSKVYGLAGLRVGYGIVNPELASLLNRVRSPFNVNLAAQSAAAAAIQDREHVSKSVALNTKGREYFYYEFKRMGLNYAPSEGNFVLVDVQRDSREVFTELQKKGVIIRPGAGLGLPQHIRVTVGTEEQNAIFIKALTEVLG